MTKKFDKKFWILGIVITTLTAFTIGYAPISATNQQVAPKVKQAVSAQQTCAVAQISPLNLVKSPDTFLNKKIKFNATFDKFSSLGLDYKPAMMSSQDYIGILIKRDDITDHTIPLSELKLFLQRTEAEKYVDLSSGDKIEVEGVVFSSALGDPWVKVDKFVVLSQATKKTAKQ